MGNDIYATASNAPIRAQSWFLDLLFSLSGKLPRGRAALPRAVGRMMLGSELYQVAMPAGFEMLWPPSTIDMLVSYRRSRNWDNHVLTALLEEARPGAVCYDIGANAGYMTLSLASCEPTLKIVAFEPLPELADALAKAVKVNDFKDITILKMALTDREQTLELHLPAHAIHASLKPRGKAKILKVAGFSLDSLVTSGTIPPPDFMKIDIEGAELLMFHGASKVLSTYHPTLIFECDENSFRFGHSPKDVIAFLREQGYDKFEQLATGQDPQLLAGHALEEPPLGDFRARSTSRKSS